MMPEPSKQPFYNPLGVEALQHFCHPRHEVFRRPVRFRGGVWAANGFAAIRVTRGIVTFDDTIPESYPDFAEPMDRLPWQLVESPGTEKWRTLDDKRGVIYRGGSAGLLPLWVEGRMTEETPVMVAASCSVPLAMLQLLCRLPRAEVRMKTGDFLAIRFTGGEAIIPGRWRHEAVKPTPRFALFLTDEHLKELNDRR